jgi:hypothetical protein
VLGVAPSTEEADREGRDARQELSEQERVAVDRLGEHAAERAPAEFAVDGIEAEPDGDDRDEEAQERHEGRQRILRVGEQAQEEERILRGVRAEVLDRGDDRGDAGQQHQPFEHAHARAAEMVGELLQEHRAEAGPGRSFTLPPCHRSLLRNSGCRSHRGWVP